MSQIEEFILEEQPDEVEDLFIEDDGGTFFSEIKGEPRSNQKLSQELNNIQNEINTKISQHNTSNQAHQDIRNAINNKVEKVEGKGLSTNDFTDEDKSKLDGIEDNAQVNVQSDWNETDTQSDSYIQNKPTDLADFNQDSTHRVVSDTEKALWNSKADGDDLGALETRVETAETNITNLDNTKEEKSVVSALSSRVDELDTKIDEVENEIPEVIDNVTSNDSENALSALQGKLLNDRINNIDSRGRFLALWNCATGMPLTNPSGYPFVYRTGDYFIVSEVDRGELYNAENVYNIGDKCIYNKNDYICIEDNTTGEWDSTKWESYTGVNYMPNGATYEGVPSTTIYTGEVSPNDTWLYDGTNWTLQINHKAEDDVMDVVDEDGVSFVSGRIARIVGYVKTATFNLLASAVETLQGALNTLSSQVIKGVKVNGTALTKDSDGNVDLQPITTPGQIGVTGVWGGAGLAINSTNKTLYITKATNSHIDGKSNQYSPIVSSNLDYAIEKGLGNNSLTWTAEEKASARNTIGAEDISNKKNTVSDSSTEYVSGKGLMQYVASGNGGLSKGTINKVGDTILPAGFYHKNGWQDTPAANGTILSMSHSFNDKYGYYLFGNQNAVELYFGRMSNGTLSWKKIANDEEVDTKIANAIGNAIEGAY